MRRDSVEIVMKRRYIKGVVVVIDHIIIIADHCTLTLSSSKLQFELRSI